MGTMGDYLTERRRDGPNLNEKKQFLTTLFDEIAINDLKLYIRIGTVEWQALLS